MTAASVGISGGAGSVLWFMATDLDELARAVAAQPDRDALDIHANNGSFNRRLNATEQARPPHERGTIGVTELVAPARAAARPLTLRRQGTGRPRLRA